MDENNYISGPDRLQQLNSDFISSLKEWSTEDIEQEPKLHIGGQERPILSVSITKLISHINKFTSIWKSIPKEQKQEFRGIWYIDCRGLYIESSLDDVLSMNIDSLLEFAPIQFDHSIVDIGLPLFATTRFLGDTSFYNVKFKREMRFDHTVFVGNVNFDRAIFSRNASFINCDFRGINNPSFQQVDLSKSIDFTKAKFNRAPVFYGTEFKASLPFNEATFNKNAKNLFQKDMHCDIQAWRALKNIASAQKNQHDEAVFFTLEQRYYRKAYLALRLVWQKELFRAQQGRQGLGDLLVLDTWHPSSLKYWKFCDVRWKSIEWFISWLYDLISEYGRNPNQAIGWLFGLNILFLLLYKTILIMSPSAFYFSDISTHDLPLKQHPALFFTLQNLFNPGAAFSFKTVIYPNNILVLFLSIFQFIGTNLVLILTALSLRNRFQKS